MNTRDPIAAAAAPAAGERRAGAQRRASCGARFRDRQGGALARFLAARPTARAALRLVRAPRQRRRPHPAPRSGATRGMPDDAALVAVGGYGRGELFPYSDVDVLVLLPSAAPGDGEARGAATERFITACWDAGLEIGSSVRTVDECVAMALADVTVQTALARVALPVRRAPDVQVVPSAPPRRRWTPKAFLRAKTLEMRQRHQKYENTPYSLEPNCKESPGGLRDLQTVIWVARAAGFGRKLAGARRARPHHAVRGAPAAAQRRHAEADPRPPARDRRPARGPPGVRPADRRRRELRLPVARRPARLRAADAALLLGGQGGDAAEPDPDAQHRGARHRPAGRADAADHRQVPRARRHARGRQRRPLRARSARHPRDLPGLPADGRAEGPLGADAARALQRAPPDGREVPARPGQPRDLHEDPAGERRPDARLPADERDERSRPLPVGVPAHRRPDAARPLPRLHGRPAHPHGAAQRAPLPDPRARPRVPVLLAARVDLRPALGALRRGALPRHRQGPRRRPLRARHARGAPLLPRPRHRAARTPR